MLRHEDQCLLLPSFAQCRACCVTGGVGGDREAWIFSVIAWGFALMSLKTSIPSKAIAEFPFSALTPWKEWQ